MIWEITAADELFAQQADVISLSASKVTVLEQRMGAVRIEQVNLRQVAVCEDSIDEDCAR